MNIEFIKASEALPEKSGEYLCITGKGNFAQLAYSAKHKKFNCCDDHSEEESKFYNIEVKLWSKIKADEIEKENEKMKHLTIKLWRIENWIGMRVLEQINFGPGEEWKSPKTGFEIRSYSAPEITECKRIFVRGSKKRCHNDITGINFKDCETAKKAMEEIIEAVKEFNKYYAYDDEAKTEVPDMETTVVG